MHHPSSPLGAVRCCSANILLQRLSLLWIRPPWVELCTAGHCSVRAIVNIQPTPVKWTAHHPVGEDDILLRAAVRKANQGRKILDASTPACVSGVGERIGTDMHPRTRCVWKEFRIIFSFYIITNCFLDKKHMQFTQYLWVKSLPQAPQKSTAFSLHYSVPTFVHKLC